MIRKIFFWAHLASGVTAGLVILMMSVTGVLLTYERQILAWADRSLHSAPAETSGAAAEPQSLGALVAAVKAHAPEFAATSITVSADSNAPASVGAGRAGALYVDRYSGEILGEGAPRLRAFFAAVTGWHRWFNASGESRTTARAITGASNLLFLFLIASGLYLWLPRVFRWAAFKARLLLNPKATTAKARDFNWHHVFGIWSALPLAVVVATAVVFSYGWANDLVYRSFGEEPPSRGGPPRGASGPGAPPATAGTPRAAGGSVPVGAARADVSQVAGSATPRASAELLPLDALFARAAEHAGEWRRISVQLPRDGATEVAFTIDRGNGGQPQHRHTLILDARSGDVAAWRPFSTQSRGQQARSWIRFLHTGEALGVVGQTIAGVVSLTSLLMVWTGLALAYRRLIAPLFVREKR